ncbi:MAG: GNAT family N-acetyltransferase [Flavobacteriales bacterium]
MDYHNNRFTDFSLMVYKKEKLFALLPLNIENGVGYSHQGLTYGGFLLPKKIKFNDVLYLFENTLKFLSEKKINKLLVNPSPKIYHTYPSDEIDFLLFILKANIKSATISSTILVEDKIKIQSNRIEGVKKANKYGLTVVKDSNFDSFWKQILIPNLKQKHNTVPVHSLEEIKLLAKRFQENIHQFNVFYNNKIVGGATIFETKQVAHVQYISANKDKQKLGTLDFLFDYLINSKYKNKKYFDFGTSNENNGMNVNQGLLYWKECFGARSIVNNSYEVNTSNYHNLSKVLI